MERKRHEPSRISLVGLNAVNFFLAEVVGVVMPFLADLLRDHGWRYDLIGVATSAAGFGVLVAQAPVGVLLERLSGHRMWLAASSLVLGVAFGSVPLFMSMHAAALTALFVGGVAQAFFVPALGALALGLVGHERMHRMMAVNQAYNHAGNIASAVVAMLIVTRFGVGSVFAAILVVSVLAAASCLLIRPADLRHDGRDQTRPDLRPRLRLDREVLVLVVAVALFHLANAPAMPLVALEVKALHGSDTQVAAVVFVAQCVMVPVAWACGPLAGRLGRKPVFAAGFVALPLRLVAYTLVGSPSALVALQSLDGIGAGVYGVLIAATCSDLARRGHGFTTLIGVTATAQALGGFVGPLVTGALLQHLGFLWAFLALGGIAALAALVYLVGMPETAARSTLTGSAPATSLR